MLCLPHGTHKGLHIGVTHDRLPAPDIGKKVGIGLTSPAMGNQDHSLRHPLIHSGFGPHLAPVGFHHHIIPIFYTKSLGRLGANFGNRFRVSFFQGLDVTMLAVSVV